MYGHKHRESYRYRWQKSWALFLHLSNLCLRDLSVTCCCGSLRYSFLQTFLDQQQMSCSISSRNNEALPTYVLWPLLSSPSLHCMVSGSVHIPFRWCARRVLGATCLLMDESAAASSLTEVSLFESSTTRMGLSLRFYPSCCYYSIASERRRARPPFPWEAGLNPVFSKSCSNVAWTVYTAGSVHCCRQAVKQNSQVKESCLEAKHPHPTSKEHELAAQIWHWWNSHHIYDLK